MADPLDPGQPPPDTGRPTGTATAFSGTGTPATWPTGTPGGNLPTGTASRPATLRDVADFEAKKQGIDPRLVHAVIDTESSWNPAAKSPKGAVGLMQLMPATAAKWKVDPADPVQNIRGGVSELKALLTEHQGDVTMALRRYNGSPSAPPEATQPYVDTVYRKLAEARQPTPGEDPTAAPPTPGQPPPGPPETWRQWAVRQGKQVASTFDPRQKGGRENLAGAAGAAGLGAVAAATAPVSVPLLGMGAMAAGVAGAYTGGLFENLGEQVAGTEPPSTTSALTTGAVQGLQEGVGRGAMWGVQRVGRGLVASRVGRFAAEHLEGAQTALSAAKTATLTKLQDALDSAQSLLRTTKATAREATAQARTSTAQTVSQAAAQATQGVAQAGQAAEAGTQTAAQPYERIVGTPPPNAAAAGRAANEVIQTGGAARARDLAGQAVTKAAESGPDVDITALKAEAQKVIESQIRPPETSFPRKVAQAATDEEISAQSGIAPDAVARLRATAAADPTSKAAQALATLTQAVETAQGEAGKETLKHPAMGVLARILNAADTVPFKDAHLWKVELENAIRNTRDQAVKSQVASLTQTFTGALRGALRDAGHAPYEAATAAYAKIAALYTKGIAPQLKKLAVENPEAIVSLVKTSQPTKARMLVDLLTHQAEAGGDPDAGRAALRSVQASWVRKHLIDGGLEKLGDRLTKLPPAFKEAFLSTPDAAAVLDRLQLISTAFHTAALTGEQGVEAATRAGQQGVEAARTAATGTRAAVRQAGAQAVESAAQQIAPAKRALRVGKAGFQAQEQALTEQERALGQSSLARSMHPEARARAGADLLRTAAMLSTGAGGVTHSYYGALSVMRLLRGPTANDLVHWAASSPASTRAFVTAVTSSKPGAALANLVRVSGILGSETPKEETAAPPPAPSRPAARPPGAVPPQIPVGQVGSAPPAPASP